MALVWETARVVTGIEKSHKQVAKETADTAASDRLALQAMMQAGAGGGIVAQTGTTLLQYRVAAELTVDQGDRKREFVKLNEWPEQAEEEARRSQEVERCFIPLASLAPDEDAIREHEKEGHQEFHICAGGSVDAVKWILHKPDRECTIEQLSALAAILQNGDVIHVDFAVWGPFQGRTKKRRTFSGYTVGADGQLHLSEHKGPESHAEWESCYEIFKTACIMLKACKRETMDRHQQKIKKLYSAYGAQCWALLYQADTRTRLKQFERILRRGQGLRQASLANGGAKTDFNPWWTDEFERPALLIRAHVDRVGQHLESGTGMGSSSSGGAALVAPRQPRDQPPPDKFGSQDRSRSGQLTRSFRRKHNVQGDKHTSNWLGVELCRHFNKGVCVSTVLGESGAPLCGRNPHLAHQCELCLGRHAANPNGGKPCNIGSTTASTSPGGFQRKEKGKGGKGGKGGKAKGSNY